MNFFTQLKTARASFPLFLFALTSAILLSGCNRDNPKPQKTTIIKGKVVTFREDSLYFDGPIDVTLRFSFGESPRDAIETKTIYPPYKYEFKTDTTDRVWEWFVVDVETRVPKHKVYYAGDGQFVEAGGNYQITTNLMPKTSIRYELVNENGASDKYIAISRIGGGSVFSFTTSTDFIMDEGWYNGMYPVRYGIVNKNTGEVTSYTDTIFLEPFITNYHTIRY